MSNTIKKSFNSLAIIMIFCQLFFVGSFLFYPAQILAEEETTLPDPIVVETPAETPVIVVETPAETSTEPTELETPAEMPAEPPATETPSAEPPAEEPTEEPAVPALAEPGNTGPTETSLSIVGDPVVAPPATPEPLICAEESDPVFVIGGSSNSAPSAEPINLQMESAPLIGPRVLSVWAMNNIKNDSNAYLGTDDDSAAGAQFLPSGQFSAHKDLAICALVTNNTGTAEVKASLSYPTAIARQNESGAPECGQAFGSELTLSALTNPEALELFCQQIKNTNNNLPAFYNGLNFDVLCNELQSGAAQVYCTEQSLAYNDPAGDYQMKVSATDTAGRLSPTLESSFKYLELTAYAVDFDNISYGPVQPHTPKVIKGDTVWNTPAGPNPATVSNVGNTRLRLIIKQNDFGLGKTGDAWNVSYTGRIGDSEFVTYSPNTPTPLAKTMELGEINSLDFGINVFYFPPDSTAAYAGEMFLTAEKVDYLACQ